MEILLEAADTLRNSGIKRLKPDFLIPDEYASIKTEQLVSVQQSDSKGRGIFAAAHLAAGTLFMVAKPIGLTMDWEDDWEVDGDDGDSDDDEKEPRLNELLLLQVLEVIKQAPSIWQELLSTLFPRDHTELSKLPTWVCDDDSVFIQIEVLIAEITQMPELANVARDIAKRLPLIIRYNVLSVETCPELLSYPGPDGYSDLSGVGLYHMPSFFNHSAAPNCNRWAVGDVMGFVTNQDVLAGEELRISYIEHDVLCETAFRRNAMLSMDFKDTDDTDDMQRESQFAEEGPLMPVVDSAIQNDLMSMDPFSRLSAIDDLTQQAIGERPGNKEDFINPANESIDGVSEFWFKCDVQNLRILKALTLESIGQSSQALKLWDEAVLFAESNLPPMDENAIVLLTHAALCASLAGCPRQATEYAWKGYTQHQQLFGGDISLFRRRMAPDLTHAIRPTGSVGKIAATVEALWPMEQRF